MISMSKLEIPEDGNDVLDDALDAKQFWYKGYALSVSDFNMLIRLVIQIIYINWNRNIKRKMLIFNHTKLWFMSKLSSLWKITALIRPRRLRQYCLLLVSYLSFLFIYFIY